VYKEKQFQAKSSGMKSVEGVPDRNLESTFRYDQFPNIHNDPRIMNTFSRIKNHA
jgi:hypothetical protein